MLPLLAVEAFGQNARNRGFAHAARAGEQISMMQAAFVERIAQSLHHMLLADQIGKGFRPPLTGENLISHKIYWFPDMLPSVQTRTQQIKKSL